jgi:hypothetical protein
MIIRAGDSIWLIAGRIIAKRRGPSGRGSDPTPPLPYRQEQMRRRHEWEQRRLENEIIDRNWAEPPPEPDDPTNVGQLLDREYARHQRRFRSWDYPVFDPSPRDDSLPREEWDKHVQKFLVDPTKTPGAQVATDPYAMVGSDAVMGVRSALLRGPGGDSITNRGVAQKIREHYGMGRPRA